MLLYTARLMICYWIPTLLIPLHYISLRRDYYLLLLSGISDQSVTVARLCCSGGQAAAAGMAPLPAPVSSRLQSALSDVANQHQQHQDAVMRDLEQTVSTSRRFIIGHTISLAAVFVSLVGLMFYTRWHWRQRQFDAALETDSLSNSC